MYSNPILRGLNPDPTICRVGEDYYLATSTMFLYPGVPIYHSRDLIHWRLIGHCLTRAAHFQPDKTKQYGSPMIYAPTLRYHNGVFYMITTNVHGGGNFYVTATNAEGPWSDPIEIDADVFDPSLFFDSNGKVYYTRRGDLNTKDVVQAEIDINTGKLLTALCPIATGFVSDDAEGPHLYRIGEWYYLLHAEGGSRFLHMATIGRSRSPWGPFEPCPHNPIIAQHHAWWHNLRSIGHGDLVEAHDGSWWIVYLGTRHSGYDSLTLLGRETFLAPVEWVEDWPVVNIQAQRELTVDSPTLSPHPWDPLPVRDNFDAPELRLEWTMIAPPVKGICDITERPGYLRLYGQADPLREGKPSAFIGLRQQEFIFTASTTLEFTPQSENEEAGITIFLRGNYHYDLCVTQRNGQTSLILRKTVGDMSLEAATVPLPNGVLELGVTGDERRYHFAFRIDDGKWCEIGTALTQLITAEIAETWSGILLGPYSMGNGTACQTPADFDWFEYRGNSANDNG